MNKEEKLIKIDPVMFTFSEQTNNTRKKEKKKAKSNIKIKTKNQKKKDTLKKQSLLRMIRSHQEDKYKQIFNKNKEKKLNEMKKDDNEELFKDSFETSKEYLKSLINDKSEKEKAKKNFTLKNNDPVNRSNKEPLIINTKIEDIPLSIDLTNIGKTNDKTLDNIVIPKLENEIVPVEIEENRDNLIESNIKIPEQPKFGILKNGTLPTYRNYFNKTMKAGNKPYINHSELREKFLKKKNYSEIYKKNKRKKTVRRTFQTGKSLKVPKISVLVSNKTIRNNTSLKILKSKEVPMSKIKKELIKRGLIKTGTIAPNDLLRKMYETIELLCGDVQNYNSDTLLYNFMNDK